MATSDKELYCVQGGCASSCVRRFTSEKGMPEQAHAHRQCHPEAPSAITCSAHSTKRVSDRAPVCVQGQLSLVVYEEQVSCPGQQGKAGERAQKLLIFCFVFGSSWRIKLSQRA